MRCPYCGSTNTQVKDSRPSEDHTTIRRRRVCADCGGRFTTFERVQLRELTVVKRSGRRMPFDRDKLQRSISAAYKNFREAKDFEALLGELAGGETAEETASADD